MMDIAPAPPAFTPCTVRGLVGYSASVLRPGRGTGTFRVHNVTAKQAEEVCARVDAERKAREYTRDPLCCGDYETRRRFIEAQEKVTA